MRAGRYSLILISLLILVGMYFRYIGIIQHLSYWNDESHTAIFARGILQTGSPVNPIGQGTGYYQLFMYYITALSFRVFGMTELAGRLPSVIIGTVLIGAIYWVMRKQIGERAALASAALVALSQMQLAWSTQLRPYVWLELGSLLIVHQCYLFLKEKKKFFTGHLAVAAIITVAATLFHSTALMNILIIGFAIALKSVLQKKYKALLYLIPIGLILLAGIFVMFHSIVDILFRFDNNPLHYRIFITQNYKWLVAGAFVGFITLIKKDNKLAYLLGGSILLIFFTAIFKINSQFVRYSLPAFPLMYVLFSYSLVWIADQASALTKSHVPVWVTTLVVFSLAAFYIYHKGKLVIKPRYYYTINYDMRENPIVDYKRTFAGIQRLTNGKDDVIVLDGWNDRVPWYMPRQKFIYVNRDKKVMIDPGFGEKMIGTIPQLEDVHNQYKRGVVLVENWESQMPPEIQDYVRKTYKHEFDVNNLPYNEDDKWSVSVYSWGL